VIAVDAGDLPAQPPIRSREAEAVAAALDDQHRHAGAIEL